MLRCVYDVYMKSVAIVGYATEGRVSAEYYAAQGYAVTICDRNEQINVPKPYKAQLGESYLGSLDKFDVVVRSAGIHPNIILAVNPSIRERLTTAVDEFLRICPTIHVIGVTGTKGKGTTSTLIARLLEADGKTVHLGGNIGRSPLEFANDIKPTDWVVLELSSFQLIDLGRSPHIGVCLMVVPEHLDWHHDLGEYIAAKKQLFTYQTRTDIAIYYAGSDLSCRIAGTGSAELVPYYAEPGAEVIDDETIQIDGQMICAVDELGLLGRHNWQNICAAITAVWEAGVHDTEVIREVITSFLGLEHRLEFVREVSEVKYYDDSFGTTPETAIVAVQSFAQPKILILGGSDKGASYDELARVVAEDNVRTVVLIGDQAARIQKSLEKAGFTSFVAGGKTMKDIVRACSETAQPGDVVLLSTACASFDMFKNYKDRAAQFVAAVHTL